MANHTPIFILTCARSGSTLLRVAMDAHPAISAPPELHLLTLAQRLLWTHRITLATADTEDPWAPAIDASRLVIDQIMARFLARTGKPVWCEKSVTSINHLDMLGALYPTARKLVLVRHAADVVASGLQAIASDPTGYDFEPYLAADPLRPQALLRYWVEKTERLAGAGGHRVRYEDFVRDPDSELAAMANALDLEPIPDWSRRIYAEAAERGPGDASAYERDRVTTGSLGKGSTLAWDGVSRNLVRQANRVLASLDYPPLDSEER